MRIGIIILFLSISLGSLAQSDSVGYSETHYPVNKKRGKSLAIAGATTYVVTMTGLYYLWYADYPQSNFRFINDDSEWLQMDKIGHATTSYHVGNIGYDILKELGASEKQAIWIGGSFGFIYLAGVEILDGFSAEWGASPGDILANTLGASLFIGQQLWWKEQRIALKVSYHHTQYRQYRPDLLGQNKLQGMLKDYNGQTYWLSANIKSFIRSESRFPAWLNVAIGYSGEGMTGASANVLSYNGNPIPAFERRRQFF